ncbi:hypothetical protein B0H15DRAFT_956008 [Mycena belliarum]|uniref:Uncharacterized protein n=1 Tax=Mycena belliarum TaxID=1033014 RepID=A0AAD6XI07_9AGAR|nr:hypothetical protein B0H15DRAFT_956008 [Mycena belliae]
MKLFPSALSSNLCAGHPYVPLFGPPKSYIYAPPIRSFLKAFMFSAERGPRQGAVRVHPTITPPRLPCRRRRLSAQTERTDCGVGVASAFKGPNFVSRRTQGMTENTTSVLLRGCAPIQRFGTHESKPA